MNFCNWQDGYLCMISRMNCPYTKDRVYNLGTSKHPDYVVSFEENPSCSSCADFDAADGIEELFVKR